MKGLIVFLVVLILAALVSYFVSVIPPGEALYGLLNLKDFQILGENSPLILKSLINGVVWGIVIWLIYEVARKAKPSKEKSLVEIVEKKEPSQ